MDAGSPNRRSASASSASVRCGLLFFFRLGAEIPSVLAAARVGQERVLGLLQISGPASPRNGIRVQRHRGFEKLRGPSRPVRTTRLQQLAGSRERLQPVRLEVERRSLTRASTRHQQLHEPNPRARPFNPKTHGAPKTWIHPDGSPHRHGWRQFKHPHQEQV